MYALVQNLKLTNIKICQMLFSRSLLSHTVEPNEAHFEIILIDLEFNNVAKRMISELFSFNIF